MSLDPGFKEIAPILELLRFPASRQEAAGTECPHCTSLLTLSQPDPGLPDRLIGACEQCKHWYLIDTVPDMSEGTMLRLPDMQVIRKLSRENPSAGISLMNNEGAEDLPGEPRHQ
jgi:hypothetical protein